jgi:hypothetical protein
VHRAAVGTIQRCWLGSVGVLEHRDGSRRDSGSFESDLADAMFQQQENRESGLTCEGGNPHGR